MHRLIASHEGIQSLRHAKFPPFLDELPRRKQRGIRYRITDFFDAASGGEFDPCWIKMHAHRSQKVTKNLIPPIHLTSIP